MLADLRLQSCALTGRLNKHQSYLKQMGTCRGDLVSIETWFQPEGRMCACRNWIVRDAKSMEEIGRGTRFDTTCNESATKSSHNNAWNEL